MEDDGGLGIRNWGYYEHSLKGNLGLQLMSGIVDHETKPLFTGRDSAFMSNGGFIHRGCSLPGPQVPMEFMQDGWINQREKTYPVFPGHQNFTALSEGLGTHSSQNLLSPDPSKDERMLQTEDTGGKKDMPLKKRSTGRACKPPKAKMAKNNSGISKKEMNYSASRTKAMKKSVEVMINGIDVDISGIPTPVCSCTGSPQQCYRWGCGGWQSACCTTTISNYPLPLSTKRRGARIAGRKMSQGAFKKVLEKLAAEGQNLSNPIDLKTHWAKHGTNKFVTIK